MNYKEVESTMRNYKHYEAIKKELELDYELIKTRSTSEVAVKQIYKKSDILDKQIEQKQREIKEIEIMIERIDSWLRYLTKVEAHVCREFYIEKTSWVMINDRWQRKGKDNYYCRASWTRIKSRAIKKIVALTQKKPLN